MIMPVEKNTKKAKKFVNTSINAIITQVFIFEQHDLIAIYETSLLAAK